MVDSTSVDEVVDLYPIISLLVVVSTSSSGITVVVGKILSVVVERTFAEVVVDGGLIVYDGKVEEGGVVV